MAKLQIQIDDQVNDLLNQLSRKSDRSLFIEVAIKKAFADKKIREMFSWSAKEQEASGEHQEKSSAVKKNTEKPAPKKKIKFDNEFK